MHKEIPVLTLEEHKALVEECSTRVTKEGELALAKACIDKARESKVFLKPNKLKTTKQCRISEKR